MKTILALVAVIFCSLNAFGQSAQYRPTPFANGFVQTINSQGAAQTYFGMPATTNMALLNQSQTWTGTPTFPAAAFPANNIGMRLLWSSPTNIYIDTTAASATPLTNNGDFALGTKLFIASIPPLLGSNSAIVFQYTFMRTNANAASPTVVFYVGPNTNYAGGVSGFIGTASSYLVATGPLALIQGASSHTNQIVLLNALGAVVGPQNLFDSTVTNNFYANVYATTAATNILLYGARLYEFYAP